MIENTISDGVTVDGAQATLLAGRYRIVRQLGQGGMGSVWLAEDTQLDGKLFAVKMLPSILVSNKRAYSQLKAEALVSMKLTHPNIVTLRAFEENKGNPFLVMDYIDGETLDDYLAEKGTLTEGEAIKLLGPLAAALDYAHREGVVHRDVKPANVMIRKDGHPFVLDFGIAREIQETMTRVTGKLSSGTLLYMSPEQLNGASPKKEQDIYSFAAMAYECLKGNPPFHRGQIEHQILNNLPEPLDEGEVSVPSSVVGGVMAGLAKKAEDRPKSCTAVLTGGDYNAEKRGGAETVGNAVRVKRVVPAQRNIIPLSRQMPVKRNVVPVSKQEQIIGFLKVLAGLLFLCVIGGIWLAIRDGGRASLAKAPVSIAEVSQPPVVKTNSPVANSVKLLPESAPKQPVGMTEADVTEIAVAAKVQKGRIERIDDSNGFKARKDTLSDLLAQAVAYGDAKRWDKSAVSFTNYVEGCKSLVALDGKRLAAIQSRTKAQEAFRTAESEGAKTYDREDWNAAVGVWQKAAREFEHMGFEDASESFEKASRMFAESGREAKKHKKRAEEKLAEEKRIAEERQARLFQLEQDGNAVVRQNLIGVWSGTTTYSTGGGADISMKYEYAFLANGLAELTSITRWDGGERTNHEKGSWFVTNNGKTVGVKISAGTNSGQTWLFHLKKHSDDVFEFQWDINSLKSLNNRSGASNERYWYDSAGMYHYEADFKNGWSSHHVVNTETPKILRRSR